MQKSIIRRQGVEKSLEKSGNNHALLLAKSQRLQQHLRRLTRKIMLAQEHERRRTSRQLHDEIAQTLLAIHLRLLTLRTSAQANTESLKKEIANTQRLVKESARMFKRWTNEYNGHHET